MMDDEGSGCSLMGAMLFLFLLTVGLSVLPALALVGH